MTLALPFNEAIRDTFQAWHAERDSIEAELNDSVTALAAYQSNLDTWQQQLARERDDLRNAREQIERDRATTEKSHSESSTAMVAELNAAREKITSLTTLLLNRTEELRTLDNRRAEVQTELELARAREKEMKATLDEHQRAADHERSEWAEELHQLREVLERQLEPPGMQEPVVVERPAPQAPAPANTQTGGGAQVLPRENPVLGSIVEQFGKLRQQRATERQASNRPR